MSKALDYIKGKIADLEDDLQHFTMVDKDKVQAFFIKCELDNLKLVEKELNTIKISTEKEELFDYITEFIKNVEVSDSGIYYISFKGNPPYLNCIEIDKDHYNKFNKIKESQKEENNMNKYKEALNELNYMLMIDDNDNFYSSDERLSTYNTIKEAIEKIMETNIYDINDNELNTQQPFCISTRKSIEDEYEREQEEIRKNVIEYFKNSEMNSLSMLADIEYLVLNEMDGLKNKWLWKLYFNKIREDLQSFHGTELAEDDDEVDVTDECTNSKITECSRELSQKEENKYIDFCKEDSKMSIESRKELFNIYDIVVFEDETGITQDCVCSIGKEREIDDIFGVIECNNHNIIYDDGSYKVWEKDGKNMPYYSTNKKIIHLYTLKNDNRFYEVYPMDDYSVTENANPNKALEIIKNESIKEMKALNCLLSIINCYIKEDKKYGIFPENTIKKDVEEAKTILETFIKKEYKKRQEESGIVKNNYWKD